MKNSVFAIDNLNFVNFKIDLRVYQQVCLNIILTFQLRVEHLGKQKFKQQRQKQLFYIKPLLQI